METEQQSKFQQLLRELFQFDSADLDFGVYRIMNHKRDEIERFITQDLPKMVAAELDHGSLAQQSALANELEDVTEEITRTLGDDAFDDQGNVAETYRSTPLGKRYLELKSRELDQRGREALEASIFNHLHTFFSRYYQDGDFISKRRYSKHQKYAIPYNGEEVYLYWVNNDQYYVKSVEHFRDYSFSSHGVTVRFKLTSANVEQNNVKGDSRHFVPLSANAAWNPSTQEVTIPFEFRPLSEQEKLSYGKNHQQEALIKDALDQIQAEFSPKNAGAALSALFAERRKDMEGTPVSYLEHHLRQYTKRNTSDFFIHKDLKGFLERELDFYLKNEVLSLNELEAQGEAGSEGWFQIMRVMSRIGSRIVEFLDQLESFQKMLWEKAKFVTETQYCITLGTIDRGFYPKIAACEEQWEEWKQLLSIDKERPELFTPGDTLNDNRVAYLENNPTLVLDTKNFDDPFVDELLASFDGLDDLTDGLLVHSENFQALNLLSEEFRGEVECIYTDPPYNTGDSEILYKNEYLRSSWLTLMENRLFAGTMLLSQDPVIFIAIDDFEVVDLSALVDKHFPTLRREMIVVNHHPQGGKGKTLAATHEYMLTCVMRDSDRTLAGRMTKDGIERRPFKRSGTAESNFRYGRPNSFYAILIDQQSKTVVGIEPPPKGDDYPTGNTEEGYVRVYPLGTQGEERVWRRSYESCLALIKGNKLECTDNQTIYHLIDAQDRTAALFSNWVGSRFNAGTFGANLLGDIIGAHNPFPYPKSIHTVEDAIFAARVEDDAYCLDYFAGSGTTAHAAINLNREDGGNRKFILVEMGEYFDTVLLPRIKKVTFSPEWKDGMPKRVATADEAERSPRIVKYIRLESYEDALNNIEFDEASGQRGLEFDDYILKYMLRWETRGSATLLNTERLTTPFSYKMETVRNGETTESIVCIPETFNHLIGLRVKSRRTYNDDGRYYLVYRGVIDHREVAVIWRETEGWKQPDWERDKEFVAEQKMADGVSEILVNGDSFIPNSRALEPIFKARMFSKVDQ